MRARNIIIFVVVVVVVALPLAAVAVLLVTFNPNAYAPQIIAAVQAATGRQLTLGSPIQIALSLTPTIEADDVSLANPPGFADANFLTLQRVEARLALWPLLSHRLDIQRLVLIGPVVTLQTTASGQADWNFTPIAAAPSAAAPGAVAPSAAAPVAPATTAHHQYKVTLESVELQNGQLILKNAEGAETGALSITDLTGAAESASAPLKLDATATFNGAPFTLDGQVGAIERFSGIGSGPWPVDLSLAANGATATLNGTFAHPRRGRGYDLAVTAAIPALEAFQPWAGAAVTLPPIHNLTAAAHLTDQNSALPAITALFVKAGASDLSSFRPGLLLTQADIEMPSLSQPVSIDVAGTLNNAPLSATGTVGAIAALLNPAWLPPAPPSLNPQAQPPSYQVNLAFQAGAAKLTVTGGVATPGTYNGTPVAGVALAVNATIPDLSALGSLAGYPLPAWKNIQIQTTVSDPGGLGLEKSVGLDGLTVSMDNAAFGGDASLYFGANPKLDLALKGQQINLDALLAAWPAPAPAAAAPTPAAPMPAAPMPAAPSPAAIENAAPNVQTADFTQSTAQLPIKLLQTASADIQLATDTLIINKATYTALQTHAVLANGVLTINPLTAILPGGGIAANATIDATKTPAAETIAINAPALALAPFLKAIDVPDDAEGTIQASLTASGAGDTPHDFFSTINGQLGMASVNFVVDGTVLDALFGAVLRTVDLPESIIGAQGPVTGRCFALRVDASDGTGTVRALTLDSSRLLVQGGGTLNFGDESLAVIIQPQLRVAGANVSVPVQIGGTFDNPTTSVAPGNAIAAASKAAIGLSIDAVTHAAQTTSLLGTIANQLHLISPQAATPAPDVCPAALALARLGAPGPAPAATQPGAPATPAPASGPQNLLNSLFGK
jgi:AsmA protein